MPKWRACVLICGTLLTGVVLEAGADPQDLLSRGTPDELRRELPAIRRSMERDAFNWTPLMVAAAANPYPESITVLLDGGEDPQARSLDDWDALCFAAAFNREVGVIRVLLDAGLDPNKRTRDAWVAAYGAARYTGGIVQIHGLAPGAALPEPPGEGGDDHADRSAPGWTPLFFAAYHNESPDVTAALLAAGADPTLRDEHGRTPKDYARAAGAEQKAVLELLSEATDVMEPDHQR